MGHTSEFLFGIYWLTWKRNNYLKNCWSGPIKNKIILIFTTLHFLKKIKKNNCRYHYQNLGDMVYSSWDIYRAKYTEILKLKKNTSRYYHFTHLHHKWQSYDVWFLRYGAQQTEFFVILDYFLPFHPPMEPGNQNF